ncbi:MAG: leucine-rich repeat domain-containing protein, partial [Clostridia bacterium]|nr:leucine-rich repeat domain-containing protein [Clostridia bacterium]
DIKQVADAIGSLITFSGGEGDGGATAGLVSLLNNALSSDLSGLLTEMRADNTQIKVGVSVDAVLDMLGVDTGIKFGSCALGYTRGEGVYGGELAASLPALGFELKVSGAEGAIEAPATDDCLDLIYLIEDVKEIATADLLKARITLDGSKGGVAISQLDGLTAGVDVYFNLQNIAVAADIDLGYTYGEDKISAELSAWYEGGKVVLSLNAINGSPLSAKVYCDIDEIAEAVTSLLSYADVKISPFEKEEGGLQTADILTKILGADFGALLPVLRTGEDGLNVAVNVDEALKLFGVNIGFDFGNVALAYSHSAESKLVAAVPALGLSVDISGATVGLEAMPDPADCLDLTKLVNTVQAVWEQVDGIIEGQSVAFEIIKGDTFLYLDGIKVEIWGVGEVCWIKGSEYVALDLSMSISETGTDVTQLKLIYDKNAENTPLVRLALNDVGIDIYREDIDGVVSGFNDIYNKVMPLFGGNGGSEQSSAQPEQSGESGEKLNTDKLLSVLFGVLSSDSWVEALNDFTVTCDGKSAALEYLSDNAASVEISADGCLALYYDGEFENGFTLGGGITATSVGGSVIPAIERKLDNINMSSSKTEGSAAFVKLAYDFLFEAISNVSVENILGSKTYTVKFELNGANTNIQELENVFIDAQIYITGEKADEGKLAEGYLNIDAAGVVIKLHVITERRGNNTHFYINLSQVADVKLPDLKFLATQESLYQTFEVLVATINDTNLLDVAGSLLGGGEDKQPAPDKTESAEANEKKPVISQEQTDKIADILSKLLEFNFGDAVVATEVDGVVTANIDLDNIVKQFGVQTGKLGTVEAVINRNDHSMKTSGKTQICDADGTVKEKEWIWLSSELAERRSYEEFKRSDYISIEFLPTLIDDLVKTATDENGNLHDKFTLSGTVDVNIVSLITVKLEITTLTVNLNGANGLYLSLIANLSGGMVSNGTIGLTYQNGYLTLGRNLSTATPEYRVMTFEYFLDNMFAKGSNSTINWLLGVNDTLWNMVRGKIGELANIDSGLTTPENIYLYKPATSKEEQEISMYDFVKALRVVTDGRQTAVFGDYSALESDLGVSDNYYGFALDAGKITGGVLTKLNAAITRGESGLDRVIANGAIQSYVSFGADLQFKDGWTEDYEIGTANNGGKTAPSLYDIALKEAEKAGQLPDFDHFVKKSEQGYDEKFGCFSVTGGKNGFTFSTEYSHMLYSHVLTVVGLDGVSEVRNVRHGSTIYLYDNNSPLYTDDTKAFRLLYSTSQGSVGEASVIMNGDLTVYAVRRKAVNVIVHSGSEEYIVTSFVGDGVPTAVAGLETVGKPAYDEAGTRLVGENDKIQDEDTVVHIYGTFVNSEVVVNDVKYTFDAATLSYTASGKAAGFNDYYSTKGNTLVLENEIGGYPVKAIAAGAFANTDGKPIKNVIIPSNITEIGGGAFLDNTGMESVIILGEYVKVGGNSSKDDNKDNDQPFYGCSTEAEGTSTKLVIYYNTIECGGSTTNTIWTKFRVSGGAIKNRYYIGQKPSNENGYAKNGGGALKPAGTWCMLDVQVSGAENVEELDFNALVNSYVTGGFKADGVYTKAQADELAAQLASALSQYKNAADGEKYVVNVSLTANSTSDLTLAVNVLFNVPKEITVYSPIAMTYANSAVAGGVNTVVYATAVDGGVSLVHPVAEDGSVFLGWAVEIGGKLEFVGQQTSCVEGTVFYAVWGKSKVNQQVLASVNYSGTSLSMPVSGNGKWYDGNWNEVTEISKQNLVVYTRATFTLGYEVSGKLITKIYDKTPNKSVSGKSSYSASVVVLEGQTVTAVRSSDGKSVTINIDGVYYTEIQLQKYFGVQYTFKPETFVNGTYTVTANDDVTLTLNY